MPKVSRPGAKDKRLPYPKPVVKKNASKRK